jgi:hypothetical protein
LTGLRGRDVLRLGGRNAMTLPHSTSQESRIKIMLDTQNSDPRTTDTDIFSLIANKNGITKLC